MKNNNQTVELFNEECKKGVQLIGIDIHHGTLQYKKRYVQEGLFILHSKLTKAELKLDINKGILVEKITVDDDIDFKHIVVKLNENESIGLAPFRSLSNTLTTFDLATFVTSAIIDLASSYKQVPEHSLLQEQSPLIRMLTSVDISIENQVLTISGIKWSEATEQRYTAPIQPEIKSGGYSGTSTLKTWELEALDRSSEAIERQRYIDRSKSNNPRPFKVISMPESPMHQVKASSYAQSNLDKAFFGNQQTL